MSDISETFQQLSSQYNLSTKDYLKNLAADKTSEAMNKLNSAIANETGFENTMGMVNTGLMGAKGGFDSIQGIRKAYNSYKENSSKNPADTKDNVEKTQEEPKTDETPQETEMTDVVGEGGEDVGEDVGTTIGKQITKTAVETGVEGAGEVAGEVGGSLLAATAVPVLGIIADLGILGSVIYTSIHGAKKAKEAKEKKEEYDKDLNKQNNIDNLKLPQTIVSAASSTKQQLLGGGASVSD
jgi:hypothetical protein